MGTKIKATFCLTLAAAAVVSGIAGLFSLAQITVSNDERLLKADDDRRERMIARACEPRGKLYRQPDSGSYVCIFTNPDGESLIRDLPDAPYLDAWEPPAPGAYVARR